MRPSANSLRWLFLSRAMLCALFIQSAPATAQQAPSGTGQRSVTAIDILLEPDATMIQHAQAANAQLLKNFPKGFALDDEHRPHVTVIQRYVRTSDLDKVYAAAAGVLANEKVTSWRLKAFKYYYLPDKATGLAGIVVEPTPDLARLQEALLDAVAPFTAPTGTAAAFVTTAQAPDVNQFTIDYVAAFVPERAGAHYNPHVTIGVGTVDYLNAMLAAPFDTFTFSLVGASVYQLGNYGTAMKRLHSFKLKK